MLDQLDHVKVSTVLPFLPALLAHPEFREGLTDAQKTFLEAYEPELLSEDEMISEMEESVSYQVTTLYRKRCRAVAWDPSVSLYHLGYIIGTIDQGLSYAEAQQFAPAANAQ